MRTWSKKIKEYAAELKTNPSTLSFGEGFALGRRVGRNRNFRLTLAAVALLGGTGYYFKDEIQYGTGAVKRTSRVAGALYLNINE